MDCRRAAAVSAGAVTVGKTFVGGSHARISVFFLIGTLLGVVLLASQGLAEMHSRSKHYSHRLRTGAGRSVRAPDPSEPSPYFDNSTSRNVTTSAGKAVFLPCKVRHLGDRTVSWIRRRDLHVLTVGRFTYTSDQRFQAIHMDNSDLWMLQIQYPQKRDAGMYECQVSTLPKISRFIALNVIVSKASIAGGPTLYLNSGSTLNLTCEVMESPVPPDYVFWYHDARVINYDIQHGVSVQTEKSPRTQSRLLIANAQPHDSGNYSCVPSNAEPASIVVHVLNGELPTSVAVGLGSNEIGGESEPSSVASVSRSAAKPNQTSAEPQWDVCEFSKKSGMVSNILRWLSHIGSVKRYHQFIYLDRFGLTEGLRIINERDQGHQRYRQDNRGRQLAFEMSF